MSDILMLESLSISNVEKLIEETIGVYTKSAARVIADYRSEKQYTEDYNTRQILELLQNSDDAHTDIIHIQLNRVNNEFVISNNGIPFGLGGVQSLMLANMSPKNKKEAIGNKGLGFRSILNWSTEVSVVTQNVVLKFSPKIAQQQYYNICKVNSKLQQKVENDDNLVNGETPFAVLAIPEIKLNSDEAEWETQIKFTYKPEELVNILNQLEAIKDETILFLKHTQQIIITGTESCDKELNKITRDNDTVEVNDTLWNIYTSGQRDYNNEKHYHYSIAWQDGLKDINAHFFTYFSTDVRSHLPCLIHATFELNASRKEINPIEENRKVLSDIAISLGEIATNQLQSCESNWDAYRLLNPEEKSDNKLLVDFYIQLQVLRNTLAIYPCVDGGYVAENEAVYHGEEFSEWVLRNNKGHLFPKLLLPANDEKNVEGKNLISFSPSVLKSIFQEITDISIEERAKLIKALLDDSFNSLHNKEDIYLPLLVDVEGKLIDDETQVFTITQRDTTEYEIPTEFVKLSFIHQKLYNELISELAEEILNKRVDEKEHNSRPLKRVLDSFVNIRSNDVLDVARYIAQKTNEELKTNQEVQRVVVKMVTSLFSIFKLDTDRDSVLNANIPLLNRLGENKAANELYLGKEFPSGELTQDIFNGIYKEKDYLMNNNFWGIDSDSFIDLEKFFLWLGVNKYIRVIKNLKEENPEEFYKEFVFSKIRKPDNITSLNFKGTRIFNEELLSLLSINKLLVLLEKDAVLRKHLSFDHSDSFTFKYGNAGWRNVESAPSYILYQISNCIDFSRYIIKGEVSDTSYYKQLDYKSDLFKKYEISEERLKLLLQRLGAIDSFDSLSLKEYYNLFEKHDEVYVKGKNSRGFYKSFLEYCSRLDKSKIAENNFDFSEFKCFARLGGVGSYYEYKSVSEVYYSDNNVLPEAILKNYWIINLQKRAGENLVKKYFGVKLLQDELKEISVSQISNSIANQDFSKYLNSVKPYLLAFRLSTLSTKDGEKNESSHLKSLNVDIVTSCEYSFTNGQSHSLSDYTFIPTKDKFYLKVPEGINLNALKNKIEFCDQVSEILSIHFKVREHKDDFLSVIKETEEETKYRIKSRELDTFLTNAKSLIGVSDEELIFWKKVFSLRGSKLPESIHSFEQLEVEVSRLDKKLFDGYSSQVDLSNFAL